MAAWGLGWFQSIYVKTYTRASPYGFGMYAAYLIVRGGVKYQEQISAIFEWLAFITLLAIPWSPQLYMSNLISPQARYFFNVFDRPLYGLCLAVLIVLMLSPKPDESISWYRPSRYMRGFLSASIWLPVAVVSYSLYLFHVQIIMSTVAAMGE